MASFSAQLTGKATFTGRVAQPQAVAPLGRSAARVARTNMTMCAAAATEALQTPHGGKLVDLMVSNVDAAIQSCTKTVECNDRQACDVELLSVGAFSPLEGFLNEAEYNSVVDNMALTDGTIFGLPIVFDTNDDTLTAGDKLLLTYQGQNIATFTVDGKFTPNKIHECLKCYGATTLEHPAVQMVAMERGKFYLSGKVEGLELPKRVFPCASPAQVRATLPANSDVLAFQCRNPIHRAHYELFTRALDADNVRAAAVCLVHPTCGPTQDDDIPGIARFHTYEVLKEEVKNEKLRWAYLPYSMHMAGPREAIQHMLIRKNYGATHFIIGRDMAGCKSSITGEDFYGAYEAQELAASKCAELGMQIVPSLNITYTEEKGYVTADIADKEGLTQKKLSGTKFRQLLRGGGDIPEWFAFKSVVKVLREETSD